MKFTARMEKLAQAPAAVAAAKAHVLMRNQCGANEDVGGFIGWVSISTMITFNEYLGFLTLMAVRGLCPLAVKLMHKTNSVRLRRYCS